MARNAAVADSFSVDPNDQSNVIGKTGGDVINYQRAGFPKPAPALAAVATRTASAGPFAQLYPSWAGPGRQSALPSTAVPAPVSGAPVATIAGQPVPPVQPTAAAPGTGPLALLGQLPSEPGFNATVAQPGVPRSPLDVLRGTPAVAPALPVPTGAETAGAAVRGAIGSAIDVTGRAELGAWDATTGALKTAGRAVGRPIAAGYQAARGFARGLLGRSTAAGVSNASAAQFQQPTAANPIPKTETAPVANIDRSDNAIGRFGLTDKEFKRRQFSGF